MSRRASCLSPSSIGARAAEVVLEWVDIVFNMKLKGCMFDDDSMGTVFKALGSPIRRSLLDCLRGQPGATLSELCAFFPDITRPGLTKHLDVLEGASLAWSERQGRTRRFYINMVPIEQIHARWTEALSVPWARGLLGLKRRLEVSTSQDKQDEQQSA